MNINDLLDMRKVTELVGDGYLRERAHPDHPSLRTLGYTEKAQWERMWCHETLTCRGLIYEAETAEVLARPWPKFFNHGEYGQDHLKRELDLSAAVEVSDKMDGSLGIIYRNPFTGELAVATRGSFDSDQARLANDQFLPELLDGDPDAGVDYMRAWRPIEGFTYLTEIIHPSNRIVLDYGRMQGLVLLGAVETATGKVYGPGFDDASWPGLRADVFPAATLTDALAMPPRPSAEGLVIRYVETGEMLKVKQEDYVRLHKIVTGLNDRAVWEHLATTGGTYEDLAADVPDEFHGWLQDTATDFLGAYRAIDEKAREDFQRILDKVEITADGADRKAFAEHAKKNERPHLMFQLLDGRDTSTAIWKELRPVGVRYMNQAAREEALS